MLNKKGEDLFGRQMMWLIFYSSFFLLVIFALKIVIGSDLILEQRASNIVSSMMVDRVLYTPGCVTYFDGSKNYPGVIDLSLFGEENINRCLSIDDKKPFGAIIELRRLDHSLASLAKVNPSVADLYYACGIKEKNFRCFTKRHNVILYEKGKYGAGYLDFFVVVINE